MRLGYGQSGNGKQLRGGVAALGVNAMLQRRFGSEHAPLNRACLRRLAIVGLHGKALVVGGRAF